MPGAGHVVVIDRTRSAVVARWELGDAAANFPMSLDAADHRLFIGCRRPARLLVYDTASGKRVAGVPIGGDTDDLFFDAARRRIYASCGAGVVDVVQQQDADHYLRATTIRTAAGARTSLFIPELARFCLAVPQRGGQQAEIQLYAVGP